MADPRLARRREASRTAWRSFMEVVDRRSQSFWMFRGVADAAAHELIPKVGREQTYDAETERKIFDNFRRRAPQFVDVSRMTLWDQLALAQHHGLPTRLLDWTINPLTAAYFAVTSEPKHATARPYVVHAPRLVEPGATAEPFNCADVVTFIPSAIAPRIVAQRGLFTIHPRPTEAWTPRLHDRKPVGTSEQRFFDIDADVQEAFERKLFQLAIDPGAVKFDLDGVCETLAWQYRRGTAVGRFNF